MINQLADAGVAREGFVVLVFSVFVAVAFPFQVKVRNFDWISELPVFRGWVMFR